MTHVFSVINLKGGVGKTTTSVALAEVFSAEMGKKALLIDLDPQTNATIMMLGENKWAELNKNGHTLAQLFKAALDPKEADFDLKATLQKNVSDVGEAKSVDLLPSSLDLIDVQDRLVTVSSGQFFAVNPIELLHRAIKSKLDKYDVAIIDCPPSLGIVTLNGLRISEGYIIPTIPDYLSTYGIPQIVTRVSKFSKAIGDGIDPLGIVVTKFQANSTVHKNVLRQLKAKDDDPKIYETVIKQTNFASAASEHRQRSRTLRQKYGDGSEGLTASYIQLAHEIWDQLEGS
ncbi:MAG: AAA family ATPase [Deltaproteobacteria bacterium]|nr:AAA family ATPase [Deltaproteobacteria bacterium]